MISSFTVVKYYQLSFLSATVTLGLLLPIIASTITTATAQNAYPSFDPMLDGRKEIAKYNLFMDEIFTRMNIAIKAKQLDPMDLKLLPTNSANSDKVPRSGAIYENVQKVKAWLHGMSTLKRTGDVSIFFHADHRTIQCPFALGPLELRVEKTIGSLMKKANAKTEIMLGLIDLRIDRRAGTASITNVYFDEPGEVNVSGNLRSHSGTPTLKHNTNGYSPYRLALASRAALSLKKVARLVVESENRQRRLWDF